VKTKVDKIFDEVKEKYLQPEELKEWSNIVEEGLTLYEEQYIKKFIDKRGKLLDIGCGGGREGIALASNGFNVYGIDLVLPMVVNAHKKSKQMKHRLHYSAMNALSLGFQNNTFNGVLMLGQVLTFIPLRKNRITALKEAFRVLKPGGKILLTTHSRNSHWKYRIYFFVKDNIRKILSLFGFNTLEPGDRFATTVGNAKSKGKHYLHMYSLEETFEDLQAAGFKVLKCNSREEIINKKETPQMREKDYYLIYAAEKG
jgi:ubiquinone/menaquinone biosynthesis C-methylase UbiE